MTGKEFEALPHVPEEIQQRCDAYLRTIPSYKNADFTRNKYRLIVRKGVIGILVDMTSINELRFCPMDKI